MSSANLPVSQEVHISFLREALCEARKCGPVRTAFCVGCVLVTHWPHLDSPGLILSRGYSRELPGNTHAEANALAKARSMTCEELTHLLGVSPPPSIGELLGNVDVYTTMEPCSVRTSGLAPCVDALILARVRRCIIGVAEPDDFVKCEGALKLKRASIEVLWLKGMQKECLHEARRGHD